MKTHKYLYPAIVSFANLLAASRKARKGKRFTDSCACFELNLEPELLRLEQELIYKTYQPGGYRDFLVHDPKQRLISAAPYRDRVVHHALMRVIEPLFEPAFIHDSYACRIDKGAHKAVDRYTAFARKYRYVLKCDIKKYFHSIDHALLFDVLQRKIACPDTLWLLKTVIDSRRDCTHIGYFPGDTLLTPISRPKGIPIGNLTSQFFANVYLTGFDHFAKQSLGLPYIRYVDDFVLFSNSKAELHWAKCDIEHYLAGLRLRLHERKCRVHRVSEGVRFLGYRIFADHRLLDKGNVLRTRQRLKRLSRAYGRGTIPFDHVHQSIQSWISHARHADTYRLRERVLGEVVFQRGGA